MRLLLTPFERFSNSLFDYFLNDFILLQYHLLSF